MNKLIISNNESLTMSSREIANLARKQHSKVMQIISDLNTLGIAKSATPLKVKNIQNGVYYDEFSLNKRDSIVVMARLSPEFTAAIVDRWQELESKQSPGFQIPQTLSQALMLAASQAEKIENQNEQLKLAAPKGDFVDRFVESNGNKSFREVAKILKANEREFRAFLVESKVMYQLGKKYTAYQTHVEAGRFYVTTGEKNGHAYTDCKFTPKGIEYIAGKWVTYKESI